MRVHPFTIAAFAALTACSSSEPSPEPLGVKADRIEIVKHQGWLTAYDGDTELITYFRIELGDGVEGRYVVARDAPDRRRPCSLDIVTPDAASQDIRSPSGDIEIRAAVPLPLRARDDAEHGGGIRLSYDQMQQLCDIVPNGIPVAIRP